MNCQRLLLRTIVSGIILVSIGASFAGADKPSQTTVMVTRTPPRLAEALKNATGNVKALLFFRPVQPLLSFDIEYRPTNQAEILTLSDRIGILERDPENNRNEITALVIQVQELNKENLVLRQATLDRVVSHNRTQFAKAIDGFRQRFPEVSILYHNDLSGLAVVEAPTRMIENAIQYEGI